VVAFQVGIGAAPQIGVSNIAEFTAWAKANPSRASFASPGAGTSSHFTGLMLSKAIGVPLTHVPYRGSAAALTDLMAGHIPILSTAFSDLPQHHRAGNLKILAIAGPKRSPATPDIPTLKEQGIDISFDVAFDMHMKAGTSPETVKRLNAALVQAINQPDVRAKLEGMGLQPSASTADELAKWQAAEFQLWAEPVKASGFKGE
jgi:tripartite-type tricarboxylate transporter receptor subunit TctC